MSKPSDTTPPPTIGRIVHYRFEAEHGNADATEAGPIVVRPAIVVSVQPDLAEQGAVGLLVFLDRCDTRAGHGTKHAAAVRDDFGDTVNAWFWPPMVGGKR